MEQRTRSQAYTRRRYAHLLDREILVPAIWDSFKKLDPRWMARNPVMFVVEVGAVITTIAFVGGLFRSGTDELFTGQVAVWLWFTVLFANFAEAVAEGRGKAQAASLRRTRSALLARRLLDGREERVAASQLRRGDTVGCEAGVLIPGGGGVVEGIALDDESG